MEIRLNELVEGGVLFNRRRNSVQGQLFLRDVREPITLDLTGNPEEDLAGRSFEFTVPEHPAEPTEEVLEILKVLDPRQIGPVACITASRKVKLASPSTLEEDAGGSSPDSSPGALQYCLHIEWFGQNGRVTVDLPGAQIRLLDINAYDFEDEGPVADPPSPEPGRNRPGSDIEVPDDEGEDDDPYQLFAEDVDAELGFGDSELEFGDSDEERSFFSANRSEEEILENLERMDAQIESGDTMPMRDLLEEAGPLPDPELLDEEAAADRLKDLLARLAVYGIAFDMCEHASARFAYQVLLRDVIDGDNVLPGMFGSGWVQHFGTHETCPECQTELEAEYGESDDLDGFDESNEFDGTENDEDDRDRRPGDDSPF